MKKENQDNDSKLDFWEQNQANLTAVVEHYNIDTRRRYRLVHYIMEEFAYNTKNWMYTKISKETFEFVYLKYYDLIEETYFPFSQHI